MTVQTEVSRSGPYDGAGTTGPFTVGFRFLADAHLRVIKTSVAAINTDLVLTTDYSVMGAGGASGTVTLTSPLLVGEKLTIIRNVPFTQEADYVDNDAFPAESHEQALDLLTMQTQQIKESSDRALTLPPTVDGVSAELPPPSANSIIGWNASATGLANIDILSIATQVATGTARAPIFSGDGSTQDFILPDSPGSLANIEASIGGSSQRPGIDYTWDGGTVLSFLTPPPVGTNNILVNYWLGLPQNYSDSATAIFVQEGTGAVQRTMQEKGRELFSVKDFGAVGDGVANDTVAFLDALAQVQNPYVPKGTYSVDLSLVNLSVFRGPGVVTYAGQRVSVESPVIDGRYVQRKQCTPFFGVNNGTTDTQIFTNAQTAPQGLAYAEVNGVEKIYISQRTAGSTWIDTERVRIIEFNYSTSGGSINNVQYTDQLELGHGAGLAAFVEGSQVYLYTNRRTPSGTSDAVTAGKGWSKITYKGSTTAQADVAEYQVFGDTGGSHIYADYGKAVVGLSTDGKYVILLALNFNAAGRTLFVYDRAEVEAMGSALSARPVYPPKLLKTLPFQNGSIFQACVSDGRYIYVNVGSTGAHARKAVAIYTLSGDLVRILYVDGPACNYSVGQLLGANVTLKFPASIEPEGISMRGSDLLLLHSDLWRNSTDIVTFEGDNWASVNNSNTGNPPTDQTNWVRTNEAATLGAWNPVTTYGYANNTQSLKVITAVRVPTGQSGEVSPQAPYSNFVSPFADNTAMANPLRYAAKNRLENYTVNWFSEANHSTGRSFEYALGDTFRVYDENIGSDNSRFSSFRRNSTGPSGTGYSAVIRANAGSSASGAGIDLYDSDSSVFPGAIREFAGGSVRRWTKITGETVFSSDAGADPLVAERVDSGNAISGYRAGVLIAGVRTSSNTSELVGFNGASVRLSTAPDGSTITGRWSVVNSTGEFRPIADNVYAFGSTSFRPTQLSAVTATINTSDATEKADREGVNLTAPWLVSPLNSQEIEFAKAVAKEIGVYKWRDSIAKKGGDARLHVGMTVQRLIALGSEHGIDVFEYGFACYDEWEDEFEPVLERIQIGTEKVQDGYQVVGQDADGKDLLEKVFIDVPVFTERQKLDGDGQPEKTLIVAAGSRYSLRGEELLLFMAAGFEARLAALEASF